MGGVLTPILVITHQIALLEPLLLSKMPPVIDDYSLGDSNHLWERTSDLEDSEHGVYHDPLSNIPRLLSGGI